MVRLPRKEIKLFVAFLFTSFNLLFIAFQTNAQSGYTNDWINFGQSYYKIPVVADAIYKLTYNDLSAAGFPVSTDPTHIQLFHRGVEQAIVVQGEEDGSFDPTDYILFYGKKNDGTLDKSLYVSPEAQPHNYYNLYSDTAVYFLTISSSQSGKRMDLVENTGTGLPALNYHIDEKLTVFSDNYWNGREYSADTYLSQFDYGEGWTGVQFKGGQYKDVVIKNVINAYSAGGQPQLEVILTGRNANMHSVEILAGPSTSALRSVSAFQFVAHENKKVNLPLEWTDISGAGQVVVRVLVQSSSVTDYISIASVKLAFPQAPTMQGVTSKLFKFDDLTATSSLSITNVPTGAVIYDISDEDNLSKLAYALSGSTATTILSGAGSQKLYVSSQTATPPSIKSVTFQNIDPSLYDYLIISNSKLMVPIDGVDPVAAYADYRASVEGGGFKPLVVEIRQLYDQFGYGETSPFAVREFARYMLGKGDPKNLFLIGRGLSVIYKFYRKGANGTYYDLVPTMGEPGSDIALTAGLDPSNQYAPAIPTGRLTAQNPGDVFAYLNKVKEIEATPYDELWRKRLVLLSGGKTESELVAFRQYINEFKAVAEGQYLGGYGLTKSKKTNNAVELINIAEEVNKGLLMITFFGHSGAASTDVEIGNVSDDVQGYRNKGKYPFILVNGCSAGSIFGNVESFGEDWTLTPDRGAVGFIAHSSFGLSSNLKKYSDQFYASAFADSSFINKPIGQILHQVIVEYLNEYSTSSVNITQVQQMNLQGDPALHLFGAKQTDYEISKNNVAIQSIDNRKVTALSESFNLQLVIRNFGKTNSDSLHVQVKRILADGTALFSDSAYAPVFYSDTLNFVLYNYEENNNFGDNTFEVTLDYLNQVSEIDENNNITSIEYYVPIGGTTNLYPPDFAVVSSNRPELVAQSNNVLGEARTFLYQIDTTVNFNSPALLQTSLSGQALVSWRPDLIESLSTDSIVYFWRTKFLDIKAGEDSSWVVSSFVYIKDSPEGWSSLIFTSIRIMKKLG